MPGSLASEKTPLLGRSDGTDSYVIEMPTIRRPHDNLKTPLQVFSTLSKILTFLIPNTPHEKAIAIEGEERTFFSLLLEMRKISRMFNEVICSNNNISPLLFCRHYERIHNLSQTISWLKSMERPWPMLVTSTATDTPIQLQLPSLETVLTLIGGSEFSSEAIYQQLRNPSSALYQNIRERCQPRSADDALVSSNHIDHLKKLRELAIEDHRFFKKMRWIACILSPVIPSSFIYILIQVTVNLYSSKDPFTSTTTTTTTLSPRDRELARNWMIIFVVGVASITSMGLMFVFISQGFCLLESTAESFRRYAEENQIGDCVNPIFDNAKREAAQTTENGLVERMTGKVIKQYSAESKSIAETITAILSLLDVHNNQPTLRTLFWDDGLHHPLSSQQDERVDSTPSAAPSALTR